MEAVTSAWGGVMTTALVATGIFVDLYLNFAVLLQRMYVFTYIYLSALVEPGKEAENGKGKEYRNNRVYSFASTLFVFFLVAITK